MILVTRPEPEASRTALLLRQRGHAPLVAPLLSVETLPLPTLPTDVQAVAVTSPRAAPAVAAIDPGIPLYAVGEATAAALARPARSAAGDVAALTRLMLAELRPDHGLVVHLGGEDLAGDLVGALRARGFRAERRVVYRTIPAAHLPAAAAVAFNAGTIAAVLFYSPRTADAFATLVRAAGLTGTLSACAAFCLSAAVAAPLRTLPFRAVDVAAQPTQDALLSLLDPAP